MTDGRGLAASTAALLLAACVQVPQHQRPDLPVPVNLPVAPAPGPAARPPADLAWEEFFVDPGVREPIRQALAHNRDLRSAVARVLEARALHGITLADIRPGADASGLANLSRLPPDLSNTGRSITNRRYEVSVANTAFEIDFWGRVRNSNEASLATYLASEEAALAVRIALIADVAGAWLALLELDDRLRIASATLANREASLRLVERRLAAGVASALDRLQAESAVESLRGELASLRRQRALAQNALDLLVGAPVTMPPAATPSARWQVTEVAVGLPSETLLVRPDVRGAEYRLLAANANIAAARAAFFPRVTLTGSLGTASRDLLGLFGGGSFVWSFLPQIRIPLFDGGRTQAALDLAQARTVTAVVDYERTIQTAFREVADALATRAGSLDQIGALERSIRIAGERLRIAERRYEVGLAAFLDVLDAQRDLYGVEQALLAVQRQKALSEVVLYKALGGGQRPSAVASALQRTGR